jgi:hypothetical protein
MKRGKKPALTNPTRTLTSNELRKKLRLIGPMIGADFSLNPDPKTLNKKSKSGRIAMNLVDADWMRSNASLAPDNTLAIMSSSQDSCSPALSFTSGPNSIWGEAVDEIAIGLLSSLYSHTLNTSENPPTVLGWGNLGSQLAAKTHEAAVQALSAGLQSWGASRILVQRFSSTMSKVFAQINTTASPIDVRLGSDGLLCEMSFEFRGTDLIKDKELCLSQLMQVPSALTSIEKLADGFRIRLISRAHSLGAEAAPAALIVFNSSPAPTSAVTLPKAG